MPCAYPIPARRPERMGSVLPGRLRLGRAAGLPDLDDEVLSFSDVLFLPCGSCVGCQLSRARSWAIRCSLELSVSSSSSFVTLTYSDRHLPPTLSKHDLSLFRRSLARRVPGVRYFACGEYGDLTRRPHYHALLFGASDRSVIEQSWGQGFVTVSEVTPARISYAAGYCAKKVGFFEAAGERVDVSTGEIYRHQPPFLQMSRRPGIGGHARRFSASWRRSAIFNGSEVPVPRYLHASWLEAASESEKADLEREKLESRMVPTVRELAASEQIALARVSLKSSGRTI